MAGRCAGNATPCDVRLRVQKKRPCQEARSAEQEEEDDDDAHGAAGLVAVARDSAQLMVHPAGGGGPRHLAGVHLAPASKCGMWPRPELSTRTCGGRADRPKRDMSAHSFVLNGGNRRRRFTHTAQTQTSNGFPTWVSRCPSSSSARPPVPVPDLTHPRSPAPFPLRCQIAAFMLNLNCDAADPSPPPAYPALPVSLPPFEPHTIPHARTHSHCPTLTHSLTHSLPSLCSVHSPTRSLPHSRSD